MTIGERMRQTRKGKGLTQKQLADACGMADSAIRKYESGQITPKISTLQRIAAALGVDVNLLISGQTLEQRDQAMKDYVARRFTEAELDKRLRDSYGAMTVEGKGKVVSYAEDILPRYRAETAPQSPPAPPEGQSTTPPPDAPETPPEGK